MFGYEDIVCWRQDYYEEENHYGSCIPCNQADACHMRSTPSPLFPSDETHLPWIALDGKSTRESTPKEEQGKYEYAGSYLPVSTNTFSELVPISPCARRFDAPRVQEFSFLEHLATNLHAHHARGIVHGNLTPESVGVVHGRGILTNQGRLPDRGVSWAPREAPDDDVYGARWAATELFRLDNGNPRPTTMSDVYSFACLMLQLLTESVPYCGTKRPEQVVYLKYLGREPIDAQTPKVADRYVAFMRWCWSPEPEKRPTMETVVDFIREEIKMLGG